MPKPKPKRKAVAKAMSKKKAGVVAAIKSAMREVATDVHMIQLVARGGRSTRFWRVPQL